MFDSIIFDLKPYFGKSATFAYFSLHPLWICYAATCVHFTVPSGTLLCFLVTASAKKKRKKEKKKNADVIKFLAILKKICLGQKNTFLFKTEKQCFH